MKALTQSHFVLTHFWAFPHPFLTFWAEMGLRITGQRDEAEVKEKYGLTNENAPRLRGVGGIAATGVEPVTLGL